MNTPPFLSVFVLLVVTMLIAGCGRHDQVDSKRLPSVVSAETVKENNVTESTQTLYSAVVQPSRQVDVAFKASGYVESIYKRAGRDGVMRVVQPGDFVHKGTVLACIRPADYQARVNEQSAALNETRASRQRGRAQLAEAETALDGAKMNFDRTARLFASDSVIKPDYDAAKNNLELSRIRVQEAKAAIDACKATEIRGLAGLTAAKLALQDCIVRAPFDGIVLKRMVEEGSLATQGTVAFSLADARAVKVSFGVPDVELRKLKLGEAVTIRTEAVPGVSFQGTITEISPDADPRSRVFNIEVSLPNTNKQLRLGMVTSLVVDNGGMSRPGLTVPLAAVIRSTVNPSGYAVFVVEQQADKNIVQERQVELGEASGHLITVLSGLKRGDRVVTNGSTRIAQGQEVKVTDEQL